MKGGIKKDTRKAGGRGLSGSGLGSLVRHGLLGSDMGSQGQALVPWARHGIQKQQIHEKELPFLGHRKCSYSRPGISSFGALCFLGYKTW